MGRGGKQSFQRPWRPFQRGSHQLGPGRTLQLGRSGLVELGGGRSELGGFSANRSAAGRKRRNPVGVVGVVELAPGGRRQLGAGGHFELAPRSPKQLGASGHLKLAPGSRKQRGASSDFELAPGAESSWTQAALSSWLQGAQSSWAQVALSSWLQGAQSSLAQAALSSWSQASVTSWSQAAVTSWSGASEWVSSFGVPRSFFMHVNAEVIFYGGTDPRAKVTVDGKPITLNPDGSFRYHFIFPDGVYEIPIVAVSPDGVESRSAILRFQRGTQKTGKVDDTAQPPLSPPMGSVLLKENTRPPNKAIASRRGRCLSAGSSSSIWKARKMPRLIPGRAIASPWKPFGGSGRLILEKRHPPTTFVNTSSIS